MKKLLSIVYLSFMFIFLSISFSYADRFDKLQQLDSWMSALNDTTPLSMISIPGTHDSGTFKLRDPVKQVWAMTQTLNFREQLEKGIRFFDIRVRATSDNELVLHHDLIYLHLNLNDFISEMKRFLQEHPSETVIMSIKEDYQSAPEVTKHVGEIFQKNFFPDPVFYHGNSFNPTLGEARGKIVVFRRYSSPYNEPGYFNYGGWRDNSTFSFYLNDNHLKAFVQDQYNVSSEKKLQEALNFLEKTKYSKNPNEIYINFLSLSSGGTAFNSPYAYSKYINGIVNNHLSTTEQFRAGWVIMDYVGNPGDEGGKNQLHREIINANRFLFNLYP